MLEAMNGEIYSYHIRSTQHCKKKLLLRFPLWHKGQHIELYVTEKRKEKKFSVL